MGHALQVAFPPILNFPFELEFFFSSLFKFDALFPNFIFTFTILKGLELPYSDMDIGITGFEKYSKYETETILSRLLENLSYMKWVKLCKPIFTASVPLLKLVNSFKIMLS